MFYLFAEKRMVQRVFHLNSILQQLLNHYVQQSKIAWWKCRKLWQTNPIKSSFSLAHRLLISKWIIDIILIELIIFKIQINKLFFKSYFFVIEKCVYIFNKRCSILQCDDIYTNQSTTIDNQKLCEIFINVFFINIFNHQN